MSYVLVIWTVVTCSQLHCKSEWRTLTEFQTKTLCEVAARELVIRPNEYRCLQVKQ